MTILTALISLVVAALSVQDWRRGLLALLAIGVLQDVVRKLTPGAPAYYLVWSGAMFGVVVTAAALSGGFKVRGVLGLGDGRLRMAWAIYIWFVVAQAVNVWVRYESLPLAILGLLFFLAPVIALQVGANFTRSEKEILKFLKVYLFIMIPTALTIYLSSWYSDDWAVLQDVGQFTGDAIVIYDMGAALASHPGIMRVGEISGWHAATAICFLMIFWTRSPSRMRRGIIAVTIVLLLGAIALTGRRKMFMIIALFLLIQWTVLAFYRKMPPLRLFAIFVLGVLGSFSLTLLDTPENSRSSAGLYAQRGATVFEDAWGRMNLAFKLLDSAIDRSQFIGLGAGATALGARFVGVNSGAEGAAEAGIGKIVVELGVPGAVVVAALLYLLAGRVWTCLGLLASFHNRMFRDAVALLALLGANVATFTVATQLFGDIFVQIILGLIAGFLFALCHAAVARRRSGSVAGRTGGTFKKDRTWPRPLTRSHERR